MSGVDEFGVAFVQLEKRLLEVRKLEEVALLTDAIDGSAAIRAAAVDELRFGNEGFVDRAIPSFVLRLVKKTALLNPLARWPGPL